MANNIGITMIGTSGTGKTCYLYAMYANMAFGVNGFTFMPTDYDQSLDLEAGWEEILNGKWPDGSGQSYDYEFECSHSLRPIMRFNWHDYRGGILTDKESPSDRENLFIKARGSNTLIMCLSAHMIRSSLQGDKSQKMRLIRYMNILQDCRDHIGRPIPVVLAITQADILNDGEAVECKDYLKDKIFMPLFISGGNWMLMIAAVSLGEGLSNIEGKVKGTIDPVNIHLPVMFSIYTALAGHLESKRKELKDEKNRKSTREDDWDREKRKSGWKRFWDGDYRETIAEDVSEIAKKISDIGGHVEELKDDLDRILDEMHMPDPKTKKPSAYLYYDGIALDSDLRSSQ